MLLLGLLFLQDPFAVEKGTYVVSFGETPMGEEEIVLAKGGFTAKGSCEIKGVLSASYEASVASAEGGAVQWTLKWKDKRAAIDSAATLKDGKLARGDQELDVSKAPRPFFFANLVWATFIPATRALAADAASGKLAPDATVTALIAEATPPTSLPVKVKEFSKTAQSFAGRPVELWAFIVNVAGVEIHLLCAPDGLPVRISVPSQQIRVVLKGFEALELPGAKPVSILDSGEWRKQLSKPKHTVTVESKVMVPMRDGVRLACDLYRPENEGKCPVVLARTPYRRTTEGLMKGMYFARRGYVFVAQDVRGRFDSEGEWFPLKHEEKDGTDTIDWISKQPWCDGNVGMIGASYVGWVQWYAAKGGHPALKAIIPQVAPPDPDQNIPYEGGVFLLSTGWWARIAERMTTGEPETAKFDWLEAFKRLPLSDLDEALGVKKAAFLDEWLAHPPTDRAYWDPLRYQTHFGSMDVAALHVSGWWDGDQPGAPMNFVGMRKGAKTERARKSQFLVMGPWTHFFNSSRTIGAFDFGKEAVVDLDSVQLRFFDRYLKGVENGVDAEDPVTVFVMGENRWRREKDWPLPGATPTKLYLAGGRANMRDGGGRLALAPEEKSEDDAFRYDPHHLPKIDVDFNDMSGAEIAKDQSKSEDREWELDYTSPPLAGPVEITGPVTATVWITTDAEDADVTVELSRITPEGKVHAFRGGIQRMRYRNGKDEPVKPGTAVAVEVDLWATGLRLEKGERLRVTVGPSGWPGYARNLGTLESPATATKGVVASVKIHHDAKRPSCVTLPVVPREGAAALRFE
jgi:hypothetical protein